MRRNFDKVNKIVLVYFKNSTKADRQKLSFIERIIFEVKKKKGPWISDFVKYSTF